MCVVVVARLLPSSYYYLTSIFLFFTTLFLLLRFLREVVKRRHTTHQEDQTHISPSPSSILCFFFFLEKLLNEEKVYLHFLFWLFSLQLCCVAHNNKNNVRASQPASTHISLYITFDVSTTEAPTAVAVCNHNNKASPNNNTRRCRRVPSTIAPVHVAVFFSLNGKKTKKDRPAELRVYCFFSVKHFLRCR